MVVIRFLRIGKKNSPSFRLVVTEKTSPPKGKFLEVIGFYNPGTKEWGLKSERATYWVEHGAQSSDTAHNFLVKHGALKGPKIAVHAKAKQEEGTPSPAGSGSEAAKEGKEAPVTSAPKTPAEGVASVPPVADEKPKEQDAEQTVASEESASAESA